MTTAMTMVTSAVTFAEGCNCAKHLPALAHSYFTNIE